MGVLNDKVALVTGAARGIGRGIALCLAEEGAEVVVNDLPQVPELSSVVEEITCLGRRALAFEADVGDRGQVQEMIQSSLTHFGRLDIAVANAAYSVRQATVEARWEDVQRILAVSQLGVFHTCQFAAQHMVARKQGGKIIVIGSIQSELPVPKSAAYNMAKAAINHLVATMAGELAPHHININVINPGWIDTPGERQFTSEEELRRGARRIPWGRLGTPRDIGRCAVFLASEDADYITGARIRIDGGYMSGLALPDSS
jgi:glucose 1-dehydrogenase